VNASLGFRCFAAAERTIQVYEAMHMIRKDKFDGWQRATSQHKSASFNVSSAALPD
jgi:hypothetical protein